VGRVAFSESVVCEQPEGGMVGRKVEDYIAVYLIYIQKSQTRVLCSFFYLGSS
jgi:hypothetical protein